MEKMSNFQNFLNRKEHEKRDFLIISIAFFYDSCLFCSILSIIIGLDLNVVFVVLAMRFSKNPL